MSTNNSFFDDVYEVVKLVPYGRVTTYGAIGRYLGLTSSARMVGWALNTCIGGEGGIPAHRVVNRNGLLTGKIHFGPGRMQELLEKEGIKVKNDQVKDFEKLFWDPNTELAM